MTSAILISSLSLSTRSSSLTMEFSTAGFESIGLEAKVNASGGGVGEATLALSFIVLEKNWSISSVVYSAKCSVSATFPAERLEGSLIGEFEGVDKLIGYVCTFIC